MITKIPSITDVIAGYETVLVMVLDMTVKVILSGGNSVAW